MSQILSVSQGETCLLCHGLFMAAIIFCLYELENDGGDSMGSPPLKLTVDHEGAQVLGEGIGVRAVRGQWELGPGLA